MITSAFTKDGLSPGDAVQHLRVWIDLVTHVDGDEVPTGIQPIACTLHRGSHNKADECSITLDASAFDFPIRLIGGAVVGVYMGQTDGPTDSVRRPENLRFYGVVVDYDIDKEERTASLKAQDLSYLCRRKTFPLRKTIMQDSDGNQVATIDPTPRYSDSLEQAITRMLSIIPEFDQTVEPPLTLRQTDALVNADLSSLVDRRATGAPIPVKPDSTVWEGIEHVCGLLGMHVKVDLAEIVVRTADEVFNGKKSKAALVFGKIGKLLHTDQFASSDSGRKSKATFIFGGETGNCFGPKFHKKPIANRNGVRVNVVDPETRKLVTAIWPPEADLRAMQHKQPRRPKVKSAKPKKTAAPPPAARDVYELDPGHYTDGALTEKAKAIWLERSRQECDGEVSTPVWTEEIAQLQNGDLITIKLDADIAEQVAQIRDDDAAAQFLQDRLDYDRPAAAAIVRAARKPSMDDWYVKELTLDPTAEKVCTIKFVNLVEI